MAIAAMAKQPQISVFQRFFWDCFGDLQTERPPAMSGVCRIPFLKVIDYAKYMGMTTSETAELVRVISAIDTHDVQRQNKKLERKMKQ